jgi:hypothetical protein
MVGLNGCGRKLSVGEGQFCLWYLGVAMMVPGLTQGTRIANHTFPVHLVLHRPGRMPYLRAQGLTVVHGARRCSKGCVYPSRWTVLRKSVV